MKSFLVKSEILTCPIGQCVKKRSPMRLDLPKPSTSFKYFSKASAKVIPFKILAEIISSGFNSSSYSRFLIHASANDLLLNVLDSVKFGSPCRFTRTCALYFFTPVDRTLSVTVPINLHPDPKPISRCKYGAPKY